MRKRERQREGGREGEKVPPTALYCHFPDIPFKYITAQMPCFMAVCNYTLLTVYSLQL
jgi:hypothetical protein